LQNKCKKVIKKNGAFLYEVRRLPFVIAAYFIFLKPNDPPRRTLLRAGVRTDHFLFSDRFCTRLFRIIYASL